jgi:hypothetical protein
MSEYWGPQRVLIFTNKSALFFVLNRGQISDFLGFPGDFQGFAVFW